MEREYDTTDLIEGIVDLGQASSETKGVIGVLEDFGQNLIAQGGLSDD